VDTVDPRGRPAIPSKDDDLRVAQPGELTGNNYHPYGRELDTPCMTIAARPGTYAIVLYAGSCTGIRVGRLGRVRIEHGYYVYVGSAFGPGGTRVRVSRHLRDGKAKRWHIDYLREVATPVCIWCSYEPQNLEHQWARAIGDMPGISGIKGFGSSDCGCSTHLFFAETRPDLARYSSVLRHAVDAWTRTERA